MVPFTYICTYAKHRYIHSVLYSSMTIEEGYHYKNVMEIMITIVVVVVVIFLTEGGGCLRMLPLCLCSCITVSPICTYKRIHTHQGYMQRKNTVFRKEADQLTKTAENMFWLEKKTGIINKQADTVSSIQTCVQSMSHLRSSWYSR